MNEYCVINEPNHIYNQGIVEFMDFMEFIDFVNDAHGVYGIHAISCWSEASLKTSKSLCDSLFRTNQITCEIESASHF